MKRLLILSPLFFFVGCVSQSEHDAALAQLNHMIDSLQVVISYCDSTISSLRDSIAILSYPAEQRFNTIVGLVQSENFDGARLEIANLQSVFPKSVQAEQCQAQLDIIEKKEAAIRAEQERMKALGFKVFKDNSSVVIGDKTCSFSSFTFGRTFTFDYCLDVDEYYYRTADKNNTYVLASMTMSTKEKYASTPSIYACRIKDGKLSRIGYFSCEFATWSSYGAKIGNYSDNSHDFSKVNSVKYKIASEITNEEARAPIVIVTAKDGFSYEDGMGVEEVAEKLHVIRIINRNKL